MVTIEYVYDHGWALGHDREGLDRWVRHSEIVKKWYCSYRDILNAIG